MQAISGLDATFLYAETPNSPMHVGSVAILEGSLKFEEFREFIKARIHLIPKLRQRLVNVPMSLDYPYWVDDPNFDLDLHLEHIALPEPGNWKELRKVTSKIHSEHLDQSRPLWSFTFVEGLDNIPQVPKGSVAIISKIHHVAIDGMAGAGILGLLFDATKKPRTIKAAPPFEPKPLPNEFSMFLNSTLSFARMPFKFPQMIADTIGSTIKAGVLSRIQQVDLPTAPFSAPPSPLNGIISARRKWNAAILSLDRIRKLKSVMETTINDIMLAICAGALRRYLLEKKKLPPKPLVAMIPVSTRSQQEATQAAGNSLSGMLIQIATNIEDPIERLEAIFENTIRGKTYQNAMGAKTLSNMAEAVPFGLANQAARLYSRYQMAELHNPAFNVLITNVPGPQFPLYLNGHKLLSIMGMAPVIDGMGLIITIFSYNGLVMLSPTSDAKTMPDIDKFTRYLRESANELEAAVLALEKEQIQKKQPESQEGEVEKLFKYIQQYLKSKPELVNGSKGIFQFALEDSAQQNWKLDLSKKNPEVRAVKARNSDVTFTLAEKNLFRIVKGELDLPTAVIQGRLKVEGDQKKAFGFGTLLTKIPKWSGESS